MRHPVSPFSFARAIFVSFFLGFFAAAAQAGPVEDAVSQIRVRYHEIESAALRSEVLTFEATDGPESGTLTRYYRGPELVKAALSYSLGDHGGADESFYYLQGQLCFVFAASSSWRFTGRTLANGEEETIDESVEQRIYFHEGKVIRDLRKVVPVPSGQNPAPLLKAADNQPFTDPDTEARVWRWGMGLPGLGSAQQALALFR